MALSLYCPPAPPPRRKPVATLEDWQQLGAALRNARDRLARFVTHLPRTKGIKLAQVRVLARIHARVVVTIELAELEMVKRDLVGPAQARRLIRGMKLAPDCCWLAQRAWGGPPTHDLAVWRKLGAAFQEITSAVATVRTRLTAPGMPQRLARRADCIGRMIELAAESLDLGLEKQHPDFGEVLFEGTGY